MTTTPNLPVLHHSFTSTGSVSWTDLASKTIKFSVDVLSRVAAAGVNPYTIIVGQQLAKKFRLGREGQEHISNAISTLQGAQSWGKLLWFGFGVKSIVHDLGQSDEGCWLLSVCAALAETYSETYAAQVIHEMVRTLDPPEQFTPSVREWLAIVHSCSGVFARSKFPTMVALCTKSAERLLPEAAHNSRGTAAGAEELAEVLMALGRISKGELQSIQVLGDRSTAWVMAYAMYFLDLKVSMIAGDGKDLLLSHRKHEDAQVMLVVASTTSPNSSSTNLALKNWTYSLTEGIESFMSATPAVVGNSGRIPWSSCLSSAFGSQIEKFSREACTVSGMVGCILRCFVSVADGEYALLEPNRYPLRPFNLHALFGQHGSSLVNNFTHAVREWFPELRLDQGAIRAAYGLPNSEDALQKWSELRSKLQDCCACNRCVRTMGENTHCLVVILVLITEVSLLLMNTDVPQDLFPTHRGMHILYDSTIAGGIPEPRQPCYLNLEEVFENLERNSSPASRMERVMFLFTGDAKIFSGFVTLRAMKIISAVAKAGICVYFGILECLTLDAVRTMRLHIRPGKIDKCGKLFDKIHDLQSDWNEDISKLDCTIAKTELIIRETPDSLEAAYRLPIVMATSLYIPCIDFLKLLASAVYTPEVSCSGKDCSEIFPASELEANSRLKKINFIIPAAQTESRDELPPELGYAEEITSPSGPVDMERSDSAASAAHSVHEYAAEPPPLEYAISDAGSERSDALSLPDISPGNDDSDFTKGSAQPEARKVELLIYQGSELGSCGFLKATARSMIADPTSYSSTFTSERLGYECLLIGRSANVCIQCCARSLINNATYAYAGNVRGGIILI